MKILITGGTGLIGTQLVQELVMHSHQVTVLSRSPQKVYSLFCKAVECWTTLNDKTNLNDFDVVINLAGEPIAEKRWTADQKKILCDSRWKITQKITDLIKASSNPPSVFLSGSAVGYYGDQGQSVITEVDQPHDEFTHDLAARWEAIAQEAESPKTRVCLLRTGLVLSPNGGLLAKILPIFKMGAGGPIGHGKQYMPWIHIKDMVKAICFLMETPGLSGPFNMTSPYPVHNDQFAAMMGDVTNRPSFIRTPAFAVRAVLGESATLLLGGQQAIPKRLEEAGFEFEFIELRIALEDLLTPEQ
ncbi:MULTISPECIES: TIGR01777 family oxidoreductase [Providencia]|uniref:TIGR01777 family protein n=2 Tax=Providencia rustigianii TaxID=158850 RepID=D1P5N7_9GAMM|nr:MULTISPECIES: TIGR01777 family oxidoreductase [Providencia]EFB71361.1 TIGR01777 family protein [Providencia rustigianii DSM 4541]MTC57877.1 TIGR01777 family protein [Providencia rustigianii]SPY78003.1 Epimerase family protein SA0724 [Providencia rustigianii]SUC36022.1 Epimerase family protein SA0724 [Providencia rustigianii]